MNILKESFVFRFFIGKTPHVISDRPMLLPRLGDLDYIAAWISMHLG